MTKRYSSKWLWLLLAAMILLRLPTLNRPLSKHHEFNTAVILINCISWQQAGGGAQFSFTPLMNFQGDENKMIQKGWHIDKHGNHAYLSYGPGWYVLPYALFHALHIPFTPLALQWLNLLIGLLTAILLFAFLKSISNNEKSAILFTAFFCLLPAPLWYMGNGYVTTAIMLPLVICILWLWFQFSENSENINFTKLAGLFMAGIMLTYIDWITVFILGGMGAWALLKTRQNQRYKLVLMVSVITGAMGVILVLAQFASYLGWYQVLGYWNSRFTERSMEHDEHGIPGLFAGVAKNIATGFAPLLVLLLAAIFAKKFSWRKIPVWLWWAVGSIALYNGLFLNWSAMHEFAWMAMGLVMVTLFSKSILAEYSWLRTICLAAYTLSLCIYFFINRPGDFNWNGERYDQPETLGRTIAAGVDKNTRILTNLDNEKIVEFYAGRTFNYATNEIEARRIADSAQLLKAVWLEVKDSKITSMERLR